jgi:hypothetical protein
VCKTGRKEAIMSLAGKWKKVSSAPCDSRYPQEIEFYDRPRYLAKKGPGQGFIWWDAGDYEITGEGRVKLSVATDAQETYRFKLTGDLLTFTDDQGCQFQYRRVS